MRLLWCCLLITGLVVLYFSCSNRTIDTKSSVQVLCTTTILADIVKNIGGDHVQVTSLMGPYVDPHLYRAREGDLHRIAQADIIFYHGLELEGKLSMVLSRIREYTLTVAVCDAIPKNLLHAAEQFEHMYDPHVWLDISLWLYVVEEITKKLISLDPDHTTHYEHNQTLYKEKLVQLDTYIHNQTTQLQPAQRVLITAHDAFSYFGARYGFKVIGLQGISTESDIGLKDIHRLITFIVNHQIPAIFVETSIPDRALRAVQRGAAMRGHTLHIGNPLYTDALGDEASPVHSYIGMMRYNIDTIVAALRK